MTLLNSLVEAHPAHVCFETALNPRRTPIEVSHLSIMCEFLLDLHLPG